MSFSTLTKERRNVLNLDTKILIMNRLEKGESVNSLAKIFNVGRSTIRKYNSKKHEILNFALNPNNCADGMINRKYMRKPTFETLDKAMYAWFIRRRSKRKPITGPLLCEKALELNKRLGGPSDFKASNGWLKSFKSRHGIHQLANQRDTISADTTAAVTFQDTFGYILTTEGYTLDDVYNADETGLNLKSLPRKSLVSQRETSASDFNISEERVTIMVAANASGSHSLPLLMIGKLEKPKSSINEPCLPLCYKVQTSAVINQDIFLDWYANDFIPKVKDFRQENNKSGKVLLLLGSAPSHPEAELLNEIDENFKVMYLPPNVTALIQPMNQGIMEKLIKMYKKQLLCRLLIAQDEESVVAFSKNLNLKQCCHMIAEAWTKLSQENLKNAWNKLLNKTGQNLETDGNNIADLNVFVDLFQTIPGFSECDEGDAREWLDNDNDPDFQCLHEDIVSFVQEEQQTVTDYSTHAPLFEDKKNKEQRSSGPTNEEALVALETAISWYEKQKKCGAIHLLALREVRDLAADTCNAKP